MEKEIPKEGAYVKLECSTTESGDKAVIIEIAGAVLRASSDIENLKDEFNVDIYSEVDLDRKERKKLNEDEFIVEFTVNYFISHSLTGADKEKFNNTLIKIFNKRFKEGLKCKINDISFANDTSFADAMIIPEEEDRYMRLLATTDKSNEEIQAGMNSLKEYIGKIAKDEFDIILEENEFKIKISDRNEYNEVEVDIYLFISHNLDEDNKKRFDSMIFKKAADLLGDYLSQRFRDSLMERFFKEDNGHDDETNMKRRRY